MKTYLAVLGVAVLLSGCAYSISDIDVSHAQPACVRECSHAYGQCTTGGPVVGFKTETLRACRETYQICINTCPAK